jgi:hypothetical protein
MAKKPAVEKKPRVNRQTLVKKAYEKVGAKLDEKGDAGKAIDDLVKLLKLEKELGEEEKDVREIRVRWVPSDEQESSKDQ